jgi:hypothetical protein
VVIGYLTKSVEVSLLESKDVENMAQFVFDNRDIVRQRYRILQYSHGRDHDPDEHKTCDNSPYHPQCIGLAKRFNKTLCALLEKNRNYNDRWHEMLPAVIFAFRTNIHASTKMSPFEFLYGRKPNLLIYSNPLRTVGAEPKCFEQYAEKFLACKRT